MAIDIQIGSWRRDRNSRYGYNVWVRGKSYIAAQRYSSRSGIMSGSILWVVHSSLSRKEKHFNGWVNDGVDVRLEAMKYVQYLMRRYPDG